MVEVEVIGAAQRELDFPTFGIVEQILSVNTLVRKDGRPVVAGIDLSLNTAVAFIFFAVENEPYFVWVSVSKTSREIDFAGVEPGGSVSLLVCSKAFDPDRITDHIGMTPTDTRWKGTARNPKRPGGPVRATHYWEFKPAFEGAGFLESKIDRLANAIAGLESRIASLPSSCAVEVSITSWQWVGMTQGFHFPREIVALASAIGASIDVDLYGTGPRLPPDG